MESNVYNDIDVLDLHYAATSDTKQVSVTGQSLCIDCTWHDMYSAERTEGIAYCETDRKLAETMTMLTAVFE